MGEVKQGVDNALTRVGYTTELQAKEEEFRELQKKTWLAMEILGCLDCNKALQASDGGAASQCGMCRQELACVAECGQCSYGLCWSCMEAEAPLAEAASALQRDCGDGGKAGGEGRRKHKKKR